MFLKESLFLQVCFLFLVSLAYGFQPRPANSNIYSTSTKPSFNDEKPKTLNSGSLLSQDKMLSPEQASNKSEDNGLVEVQEDEIPEGALVYVLEEPLEQAVDGEILKTADNIVFRPLFRYREKQEAQRRNSNRIRRRYFIPKRSYRQSYYYRPSYYNRRYYYG